VRTQGEATRRREQELVKLRKDIELLSVQHESSEASLRKRHQEAINELTDQIEQLSKHRNKSVTELDMGRVHSWVGLGHKILRLGWVGLGRAQCQKYLINMQFTHKKPIIRRL